MSEKNSEFNPEKPELASQESKDEFLNLVDILTERDPYLSDGARMKYYDLADGKRVSLFYNFENIHKRTTDPESVIVQVNITEKSNDKHTRKFFWLRKNGIMDYDIKIEKLVKDRDDELLEEISTEEISEKAAQRMRAALRTLALQKEARKSGASLVTETELREINAILERIANSEIIKPI